MQVRLKITNKNNETYYLNIGDEIGRWWSKASLDNATVIDSGLRLHTVLDNLIGAPNLKDCLIIIENACSINPHPIIVEDLSKLKKYGFVQSNPTSNTWSYDIPNCYFQLIVNPCEYKCAKNEMIINYKRGFMADELEDGMYSVDDSAAIYMLYKLIVDGVIRPL